MKIGDLVRINERCDAGAFWQGLCGKTGLVLHVGEATSKVLSEPIVQVLIGKRRHLFGYESLDVICRVVDEKKNL
jgi:hypothetical protein|tara:strand:- start:97 stop:321 length:225 start_codon:yes stop_codon:yes gene_type:complete